MPKLTKTQQRFIVQALARFRTPTEVASEVAERFGVEVSRQQVWHYHIESGEQAAEWRKLHDETRAQFVKETALIGVSHLAFRLSTYQRMLERALAMGNLNLAKEILEQAAKDSGGLFTNRREMSGMGGGPVALGIVLEQAIAKVYGSEELAEAVNELDGAEDSGADGESGGEGDLG